MIQFISDFGLPKEFSKKKKFDLLIGMYIPKDEWKNTELSWNVNQDCQKVFLTVDECARHTLESALNSGVSEDNIKNGYIAIAAFTYSVNALNDIPLKRDPHNNPVDCEWNKDTLSFWFTFRDNKWEELNISTLKIDTFTTEMDDKGNYKVTSFNVYPVIDNTIM